MMYLGNDPVGLATSLPVFSDKAQIEIGIYIPDDDINVTDNPIYINHNLGVVPDFIFFNSIGIRVTTEHDKKYILSGSIQIYANGEMGAIAARTTNINAASIVSVSANNAASVYIDNNFITNSNFKFFGHSTNSYVKKDIPYYYIVGKFKEVTSNANE